ncbi:MAG: BACON domain-containing protein [Bacteroidales bacterium]|nr:BACON domain-containing protein [Bacteroidales bacterium]
MKKVFLALLAVSVFFSCDKEKEGGKTPGGSSSPATVVRLSTTTLQFEAIGAQEQTVRVFADGDWTAETPSWITLEPESGSGTVTVTVKVSDNENVDGRTGTVVFAPELSSSTNKLTVQQKGDNKVTIKTAQALVQWLSSLSSESLDEARLAADIDMAGVALVSAEGFSGTFDGGGYAIKNLRAAGPLFKVNSGTITNVMIDGSCSFEPDSMVFGAVVARNEGIVRDCINKAGITRTLENGSRQSNLIAGVVGMSVNKETVLSGCRNYGKVSVIVPGNGSFTSQGVAGVTAYSLTDLDGCENYGEISLEGGYHTGRACPARDPADPDNIETGEFYNKKVASSVGGVAGYMFGAMHNCRNEGKVSWTENKLEGMSTSPARMFTGGVAGCYFGSVTDCTNAGAIVVNAISSDRSDFKGQNHQHCIGGVLGGVNNPSDDAPSKNRGTAVSGCSNTGTLTITTYASKSWTHIGGVVGWPASDNDNTTPSNWGVMSSCTNSGAITVDGTGLFRCGGIAGATPYMESCTNTGNITINGANLDAMVGGIAGRHWGYAQTLKNCSSHADIKATVPIDGISGLIGWVGCKSSAVIEGGSVSGSLSAVSGSSLGMIAGGGGKDGGTVTLGSSAAPIEVSGTVNGTAITTSNAETLLFGGSFDKTDHVINYVVQ